MKTLTTGLLKSFRGLICEPKDGGWELSKGALMSWIAFVQILRMTETGTLPPEFLFYAWAGTLGYNGFKMVDASGAIKALKQS